MANTNDIQAIAKALGAIPREWQKLGLTYLQKVTRRDVILLNVMALVVGVVVGYASLLFRHAAALIENLVLFSRVSLEDAPTSTTPLGPWIIVAVPVGIFLSACIVRFLGKEAGGHGVSEVIEAVIVRGGRMRKRTALIKGLASAITIGTGGSVGREGPIVQIGSALGSLFGQVLRFDSKLMKPIVGAGAAAAVAATFNTPIAGVIFAVELIVLELKTRSFVSLVTASVFATVISRYHSGNKPIFEVPSYSLQSTEELFFYVLLGIISGLIGVIFIKALYGTEDVLKKMRRTPWWAKSLVGGALVGLIGWGVPGILGMGYDTVSQVLQGQVEWQALLLMLALKILCTSLTLAAGGSGGVFAPSLFIGAMTGGLVGLVVTGLFPQLSTNVGAYALVGMAAVFSATNRATFTAIVIIFEMTLEYSVILPLMLACVAADQLAWLMIGESIDTMKLRRKGLNVATDIGVNVMSVTLVRDIMNTNVISALDTMTVGEARLRLLPSNHTIYPVTDQHGVFKGIIKLENLRLASDDDRRGIQAIMDASDAQVYPTDTVLTALRQIESSRDPRIIVIDKKTRQLRGIVSPVDFVRLSSAEVQESI